MLAYRDPTQKIVYDNYMAVRKNLDFLKSWIDNRLKDIQSGKTPEPEKTFGWYWIKNGEDSEYFNHKDVVFECFHNFVAFSQWGNTLYNIMTRLGKDTGDAQTKDWFTKTMAGNFDGPDGSAFHPAGTLRDGTVPHHLAQRGKHFGDDGNPAAGLRAIRLHCEPPHLDQPRPRAVVQPR